MKPMEYAEIHALPLNETNEVCTYNVPLST